MSLRSGAMSATYFSIWVYTCASFTVMLSKDGLKTSRSIPTMRLSSSKISSGAVACCAFFIVSSQHPMSVLSSLQSSAAPLPSADVRTITPKFFGFIDAMSCRRRSFSSVLLIFWDIEILSVNGIRTMYRPVNAISVVSLGPFDEIGSLTICTSSCWPGASVSVTEPCLSMSGRSFIFERLGMRFVSPSRSLMNAL